MDASEAAVHESMDCHGLRPRNGGFGPRNDFEGLRSCNEVMVFRWHCLLALAMLLVQQGQDVAVQGGGDVHAVGDAMGTGGVAAF